MSYKRRINKAPALQVKYDTAGRETDYAVMLPVSKSVMARDMIIRWLAGLSIESPDRMVADDNRRLCEILSTLPPREVAAVYVHPEDVEVDVGEGGTTLRFITAAVASTPGLRVSVDADTHLRQRPISPLLDALTSLGAEIDFSEIPGYPPYIVTGCHMRGGTVALGGSVSSQFASALLMCAPYWRGGLTLALSRSQVSRSYIDMTLRVMRHYGVEPQVRENEIRVTPGMYRADTPCLEPDWSAASYFYELALLQPGVPVRIASLTPPAASMQGDAVCASVFGFLGVETHYADDGSASLVADATITGGLAGSSMPIEFDMTDCPDLVPALAVAMAVARIPYMLRGLGHLRFKESDRPAALSNELQKLGFDVRITDAEGVENPSARPDAEVCLHFSGKLLPVDGSEDIDTYHDHRIAMAFAIAAARLHHVTLRDYRVVEKSFGDFYEHLYGLGFRFDRLTKSGPEPLIFAPG